MKSLLILLALVGAEPQKTDKKPEKPPEKIQETEKPKSGRWKTAHERFPKDIPKWFVDLDKDGDGQVSMSEFCDADKWTEELLKQFKHYDLNDDGIITVEEVMKVTKKEKKKNK